MLLRVLLPIFLFFVILSGGIVTLLFANHYLAVAKDFDNNSVKVQADIIEIKTRWVSGNKNHIAHEVVDYTRISYDVNGESVETKLYWGTGSNLKFTGKVGDKVDIVYLKHDVTNAQIDFRLHNTYKVLYILSGFVFLFSLLPFSISIMTYAQDTRKNEFPHGELPDYMTSEISPAEDKTSDASPDCTITSNHTVPKVGSNVGTILQVILALLIVGSILSLLVVAILGSRYTSYGVFEAQNGLQIAIGAFGFAGCIISAFHLGGVLGIIEIIKNRKSNKIESKSINIDRKEKENKKYQPKYNKK